MKILMVCLGNICRSPLAEGILTEKAKKLNLDWTIDSAGTGSWHVGNQPHEGSIKIAKKHGLDISHQKARQFVKRDLEVFDLILAMDSSNYSDIKMMSSKNNQDKIKLILNYRNPGMNMAVPDPYYGGGFDKVYKMVEEACEAIIKAHS